MTLKRGTGLEGTHYARQRAGDPKTSSRIIKFYVLSSKSWILPDDQEQHKCRSQTNLEMHHLHGDEGCGRCALATSGPEAKWRK